MAHSVFTGLVVYGILINLAGFALMGIDKYKAVHHLWRIPEAALFAAAALGGSIGSLLGMAVFHHKTRKPKFQIGMPSIFILQIAIGLILYYNIM